MLVVAAPATASAHEGWGIVVDAQRRVYVADIPRNTIWRYSPDVGMEPVLRHVHSHALVLGQNGAVYGTHVDATGPERSVWRLDAAGQMTTVLATRDALPLGLQSFLASDDGAVYSASSFQHPAPADGRRLFLVRRAPQGAVDTVAGGPVGHADGTGPGARFESVDGMAWLPDGSLVVADGTRLRRVTLDPSGSEVTTLGAPLTRRAGGEDLMGVATGPGGTVLVADFAGRAVWRVGAASVTRVHGPGRFWSPTGVAAVGDELYVLEHPLAPFGILGDLGIGPYLKLHHRDGHGRWTVLAVQWGQHSLAAGLASLTLAATVAALIGVRRRHAASARALPASHLGGEAGERAVLPPGAEHGVPPGTTPVDVVPG